MPFEDRLARVRAMVEAVEGAGERFDVQTAGGPLTWRRWGSGDPLVLVHGGAGAWTHWIRNIPEVARTRTVYAPDLPGFGTSAVSPVPQSVEAIAGLVERTFGELPGAPSTTAVASFSFGGVVSGLWAKSCPDRIRSLQIFGAVGLGVRRAALPDFARVDRALPTQVRWEAQRDNLALMMLADARGADDLALFLQDENTRRTRLRSRPMSLLNLLHRTLPTLDCPVRLVWGGRDALYPPERLEREEFAVSLAAGDARFVEGAGHWVMFEDETATNALLADEPQLPRAHGSAMIAAGYPSRSTE